MNRPYKFTIALLVANLFIFLLMWQSGGLTSAALWEFPLPVLLAYGAKLNILINAQHQWWRFVTPMFVHINLPHLLVNMYSLWIVGPYVEKLYGSAKFVVFWVVTGVAGVVASYLTVRPDMAVSPIGRFLFKLGDVPSAGASGALFGLVGVLFVFGIKFRHELPEGFKRAFGTGLLPIILINLFIGYLGRGFIDNAAHLGGLVAGAMLALVVDYRRPGERSGIAITWRVLQIAAIALVAVCFFMTAQQFRKDQQTIKFVSYAKMMTEAQEAFYPAVKEQDPTRAEVAVKALESIPDLDPKADELRERLKRLLIKAKTLSVSAENSSKSPQPDFQQQQAQLMSDFISWSKEYNTWLKTSARIYGLDDVAETESSPR